jgi:hypothetical protein
MNATSTKELRDLYLDLMKGALTASIYSEPGNFRIRPIHLKRTASLLKKIPYYVVNKALSPLRLQVGKTVDFDPSLVEDGTRWPEIAHTMIGMKRLNNLQFCCEDVLKNNIPGDFIETGVWRGGSTIFMRAILKAFGVTDRTVWVADSFAGLPPPNQAKYPADAGDDHHVYDLLRVSLEQVRRNFAKYNLLDEQVKFLKGWFSETLPGAPVDQLAVLRLDGDMYESTMDALGSLFHKVARGGYIIVDDYAIESCKKAIDDFRRERQITDKLITIDWSGVYWQKTS